MPHPQYGKFPRETGSCDRLKEVSGLSRRYARMTADGCPQMHLRLLVARRGSSEQVAGTTALPRKADLRAASSALPPISSASPQGADLPGDASVRLALTRCDEWWCGRSIGVCQQPYTTRKISHRGVPDTM